MLISKKKKRKRISLAQVRSPVGPHLQWSPRNQLISDPVGIFICTLTNAALSLTVWVIWKQQRAKLSQSVRHLFHQWLMLPYSSLSLSLWSFQSIFYQSHFFLSANITQVSSRFSVSFSISCFLFDVFSGHADLSDLTCEHFISPSSCLSGFPFSDHMLTFCLLLPSGFPSISSILLLCLGWFFLRSNISLISNVQEIGCFYNSEIILLSPTPPWKPSRFCVHKNKEGIVTAALSGPK